MTAGGKRPGAGRKPSPNGTTKISYATKLAPRIVEYLRASGNAAQTIEQAVERTPAYKKWAAERPPA
jgi:hypothetical protein